MSHSAQAQPSLPGFGPTPRRLPVAKRASICTLQDFLARILCEAPIVCFGPRDVPPGIIDLAEGIGAMLTRQRRPVVSGGAIGSDQAFARGAEAAGASVCTYLPNPVRQGRAAYVFALFARSEAALDDAHALRGAAVIALRWSSLLAILRGESPRGGSEHSAKYAIKQGIPTFLIGFDHSGKLHCRAIFP